MKPSLLDTPMGEVSFDSFTGLSVAAARIGSRHPNAFRVAQYPDGSKRIQGAYAWSQGSIGGVEWKDLPLVYVDMEGKEYDK